MPTLHVRNTLSTLAAAIAACFPLAANAAPQGASVLTGQVSMAQTGNVLNITNTPGAIINWQSFNIDRNELTRFIQQSSQSQVLNRVTGGDPSKILGSLQSNGRVLLINPNGVLFSRDARVDVAGLLISTLQIRDEDFLAGKLRFQDSGSAAGIINEGELKTAAGGSVVLIAPQIENSGLIHAPDGEILLAAGRQVSIADPDHPAIQVEITNSGNEARNLGQLIASKVSIFAGLIRNSGLLEAKSAVVGRNGKITLRADSLIDSSGTIRANGERGGDVALTTDKGKIALSGIVEAKGLPGEATLSTGQGGLIEVRAKDITIDGQIDASGAAGGGALLLGGDYQGGNSGLPDAWRNNAAMQARSSETALPIADSLNISANSQLRADAGTNGDGGVIVAWSNALTRAEGTLSARGGSSTGNGGLIEVSGRKQLIFDAAADTQANKGNRGTLLLDPANLIVVRNDQDTTSADPAISLLSAARLESSLASNDLILQADSGVTVNADIGWKTNQTLTLRSGNAIQINAGITVAGDSGGLALFHGASGYTLGPLGKVNFNGAHNVFRVNGQNYTILHAWTGTTPVGSTGYYALGSDIDASGFNGYISSFSGILDGLGHSLNKLTINRLETSNVGLFGTLSGTVANLQLSDFSIGGKTNVGSVAGRVSSTGSIRNVQTQGRLFGPGYNGYDKDLIGGVAGYNQGVIENVFADVTIRGDDNLGGIAGVNEGKILRAGAYVDIALHTDSQPYYGWVGGLVGKNASGGLIENGFALGAVSGGTDGTLGGLVGTNQSGGKILNSYADVAINRLPGSNKAGGMLGENSGNVSNSYWNAARYANSAGGLALTAEKMRTPSSFNTWSISADPAANTVWFSNGTSAPMLRNLLSTNRWIGKSGDWRWTSTDNWTLQHAPQAWENARIGASNPGMIITLDGKQTAKDLNSATSLRIESNSSLTLADSSSLSDGLQMASDTARLLQTAGTLKVHGETLALLLNGEISAPTVELSTTANSILSQSENGRLDTRQLSLDITNDATLSGTTNRIGQVSGRAGQISLSNQGDLAIDDLTAQTVLIKTSGQLSVNGAIKFGLTNTEIGTDAITPQPVSAPSPTPTSLTLIAGGNLQLGGTIEGNGNATLVAGQNVIASTGRINLEDGNRWLIYSTSPTLDDIGSLTAGFQHFAQRYDATLAYAGPGKGNGFLYRNTLLATIVTAAINKIYDSSLSAPVSPALLSLAGTGTSTLNAAYTYDSATFDTPHVGRDKSITLNGLNVAVTDGSMSVFGVQFKQALTGNVSTATLTLQAQPDQREYALSSAGVPATTSRIVPRADGLQGTDRVDNLIQAFDSAQIGNTTLSVQPGYVIQDGNGGANYSVQLLSANGVVTAPASDLSPLTYQPTSRSLAMLSVQQSQASTASSGVEDTLLTDDPTLRQCR